MNIVFAADIHESGRALQYLATALEESDALILGGDITTWGRRDFLDEALRRLSALHKPVYFVPGNHEPRTFRPPQSVVYLHAATIKLGQFSFGGLGGSNITRFRFPFELDDGEAAASLSSLGHVDILVSHCPPYDTRCDLTHAGEHIGSKPVRAFITSSRPQLVLCGHVHESMATDNINGATIVNPGPLMAGRYALLKVSQEVSVELKSASFHQLTSNE